ncbi:MAG TPA: hypothetical protein VGR36_00020 [Candidatus Acidoferrales bacterium]|nr:hypothetical protein [Candidatus Acidoferrales bacterium]
MGRLTLPETCLDFNLIARNESAIAVREREMLASKDRAMGNRDYSECGIATASGARKNRDRGE